MNLTNVLSIANSLLPQNSPWRQKLEQAKQIADQFPASKEGVEQLMKHYGKNRSDLVKALSALDSPIVANTLGRFPGMTDALKSCGSKLMETSQDTIPSAPPQAAGQADIFSRLAKLK